MPELARAKEPFVFHTRLNLSELTGLKAYTLEQFLEILKVVSGSSVYHHTHRFLQQHQYLSPEPPNDFAYWVSSTLGEGELGERLVSIDTIQYSNIRALREKIIQTIQDYITEYPRSKLRFAREGEEFFFIKSISFIFKTGHFAYDLAEFADILHKITIDSIYFHIFEARLRLEKETNDFSFWIESSLGDKELADWISGLDPYTHSLEDLRMTLVDLINRRVSDRND
jgi:hypothetical protein